MSKLSFTHSGDLGDIIYSLPTIRKAGGGTLLLRDTPGRTAHGMTEAKVCRLYPLLIQQEYIHDVKWAPNAPTHNLDGFRDHHRQGNLADMHLATHGFCWRAREDKWLKIDPKSNVPIVKKYSIVIACSERYENNEFPWRELIQHYEGYDIGFLGFPDEYEKFVNKHFVEIELIKADNFLEMALVIESCKLFVGNQSSPLALAHGLKAKSIACLNHQCGSLCHFDSDHVINAYGSKVEFPIL